MVTRVTAVWLLGLGNYTYIVIKAEVDMPRGIACFLKINCCREDAHLRWPLNAVVFFYCLSQSLVGAGYCLDSLMPCPSEAKLGNTHAEKLIYQFVSWSFLKLDLNVLLYLFIHSTLPGYFLFRWRRTALSLDSVLALQISWHLSSRSTSLRVDWKSESDSCHLLPMQCFFSMFSRESSILYGQQINIITFYLHT